MIKRGIGKEYVVNPPPPKRAFGYFSARDEIAERMRSFRQHFYWSFMTGATVVVKWPVLSTTQTSAGPYVITSDPNHAYRPWLEENVGKQGRDWQWTIDYGILNGEECDYVHITLRRGKSSLAPMIKLMWG